MRQLSGEQVKEIEPHVQCLAGLHLPATRILDYGVVCRKLAELVRDCRGDLRLRTRLIGIRFSGGLAVLETAQRERCHRSCLMYIEPQGGGGARLACVCPPKESS